MLQVVRILDFTRRGLETVPKYSVLRMGQRQARPIMILLCRADEELCMVDIPMQNYSYAGRKWPPNKEIFSASLVDTPVFLLVILLEQTIF